MATEKRIVYKEDVLAMAWLADECEVVTAGDIEDMPTVDAVEVVRCKDCKHFWESFSGSHSCKLHKGLVGTKFDTFCSYGERKDNG